MYLRFCREYIDIFVSLVLDVCSRVVLASKISFLLHFRNCGSLMAIMQLETIQSDLNKLKTLSMSRVNARNTCPIFRHTRHADLFFGHKFCVLCPNGSRFIGKVLMTITYLA